MAVSNAQSQANITNLLNQGYTQEQISSFNYGKKLSPSEAQIFLKQTPKSPATVDPMKATAINDINAAKQMNYSFDPMQALPGIQQQAQAIYAPQKAQLEAIRQLQQAQYGDARIQTEKDFTDQLTAEIESINSRGAFFGGGAIEREGDIQENKVRALTMLGMQASAADFSNLAQQGILAAEESQFINERLFNAESSAYARWTDQRNFSFQSAVQQYQLYTDERNFARSVFESDRSFDLQVEQFDFEVEKFQKTYALTTRELKLARDKFKQDKLEFGETFALQKFKAQVAQTNTGVAGLTSTGEDLADTALNQFYNNFPKLRPKTYGTDSLGQKMSLAIPGFNGN